MHNELINALIYLKLRPTRVIFHINNILQKFYQKELLRFVTELCFICYSCSLTILDINSFGSEIVDPKVCIIMADVINFSRVIN